MSSDQSVDVHPPRTANVKLVQVHPGKDRVSACARNRLHKYLRTEAGRLKHCEARLMEVVVNHGGNCRNIVSAKSPHGLSHCQATTQPSVPRKEISEYYTTLEDHGVNIDNTKSPCKAVLGYGTKTEDRLDAACSDIVS